jgi:hypothetical protein
VCYAASKEARMTDEVETLPIQGKTICEIQDRRRDTTPDLENDELVFRCADGTSYRMTHYQDCCENVRVEEVIGDLADLLDAPLLLAEERRREIDEDELWTFYEFRTPKGSVTIRWCGQSEYYSVSVDFDEITPARPRQ